MSPAQPQGETPPIRFHELSTLPLAELFERQHALASELKRRGAPFVVAREAVEHVYGIAVADDES